MNVDLEYLSDRLRKTRIAKELSQRDLSKLAGVPQSHISKIESNQVDLRLSSLIALANALGLEVTLVPRLAMPAVQSILRQTQGTEIAKKIAMQRNQQAYPSLLQDPFAPAKPAYTLDGDDE